MERDNRLVASCHHRRWRCRAASSRIGSILLVALLSATGTATAAGDEVKAGECAPACAPQKLPVIVHLLIGEHAESDRATSIAAVTAQVLGDLESRMPEEDFAAIRTFTFFPALALSADGELLLRLLSMPEVMSIERDRNLRAFHDDVPPQEELPSSGRVQMPLESDTARDGIDIMLQLE